MFNGENSVIALAAVGILSGLAVWGLLYGLIVFYAGSQARVKSRVRDFVTNEGHAVIGEDEARIRTRATLFADLDRRWQDRTLFRSISEDLESADLHITATELVLIQIGIGVAVALIVYALIPFALLGIILAPVGFIVGIYMVRSYVRFLGKRRVTRFEEQLPNNLAILAGSVRGGFSLFQALQLISKEAPEPSKTEFIRVIQEISLGSPMGTALEGLSKRMPTEDVDILVTAITMQQQTGGNLTHVLDVVANTIRERHRVEREIKSLTAQQRFSAVLLAALPFTLAVVLLFISPAYMSNLFQPGWVLCMPIGAAIMSVVGFIVMRRLADIDV